MKLLIVSQYFWPETFPINALADMLAVQGIEVTVLTGKPCYPDGYIFPGYKAWGVRREKYGTVEVVRVPVIPRGKKSGWRLARNYLSFIASGLVAAPWMLRGRRFDAVFVYAPSPVLQAIPAILVSRLKRAPLVLWVQDLWPQSLSATGHISNSAVLNMVGQVVSWIYKASDRILVQSPAFVPPVAKLTDKPEKIAYFPNLGLRSQHDVKPTSEAEALSDTLKDSFSVLFAGNLGTAQGLDTIVEAAKLLRHRQDVRIVLVGSGSLDGWLAEQKARYQLDNLLLPGRFSSGDMTAIYKGASALLVTLKTDRAFELTIPSKVQSYLGVGKPIVAALDGEGSRVIEESGSGFCVRTGDAPALADAIIALTRQTPAEREVLGKRALAYFEKEFAPERLLQELISHFEDVSGKAWRA